VPHDDNRDSAFTAITLGDLLGRSDLPRADDQFGIVPAQRSASPYVMPRRKNVAREMVPLDGVEPRSDRTFTRISEPNRRPITSTGVALAVGSLAGATIMLGNPTIVPPDPATPSHSDAGNNGDDLPVALAPASFPSPLAWAAGLGLPPSAQSSGVVPSPLPASAPSGPRHSASNPAAAGGSPRTLSDILAHNSPSSALKAPATPHLGDPSTGTKKLGTPSRTAGNS
jgi:hypothetical protein